MGGEPRDDGRFAEQYKPDRTTYLIAKFDRAQKELHAAERRAMDRAIRMAIAGQFVWFFGGLLGCAGIAVSAFLAARPGIALAIAGLLVWVAGHRAEAWGRRRMDSTLRAIQKRSVTTIEHPAAWMHATAPKRERPAVTDVRWN